MSCELLVGAHISEFSQMMKDNLEILEDSHLLKKKKASSNLRNIHLFSDELQHFNSKEPTAVPSKNNVNKVLKTIVGEESMGSFMEEEFLWGGALFTRSCNYLVAPSFFRNAETRAEAISIKSGEGKAFQKSKLLKDLRSLFLAGQKRAHPKN